jgi:hypothetical protein
MSLFNDASICITPNAFKAGKLYAVKGADLDVTRATSATRVNTNGIIETVGANVPRIDYSGGGCPSILVEPQRTNLVLNSQDFSNASWYNVNTTITTNSIEAPDGNLTADLCSYTSSTNVLSFLATNSINSDYTISVFAKKGTGNILRIRETFYFGTGVVFNLNLGTITSGTGKIENYGNGWYRCSITKSYLSSQTRLEWSFDSNENINNLYLWGAQLEAGSYATSYIPTTSAIVTRNADVISKTGISSLIGQTEGTIYFEYLNKNGLGTIPFRINGNDGKFIWIRGTGAMFFGNSSALLFNNYSTPTANQLYKIAFVYGQNDFRLYVNGSLISSITTGTFTGTFDDVQIPALPNEDPFGQQVFIKSTALWKSKLSNSELATLTTI